MRKLFVVLIALGLVLGMVGQVLAQPAPPLEVKVIIGFREPPGPSETEDIEKEGGKVKHVYTIVRAIAAAVPAGAEDRMRRNPKVTYVEPDGEVHAIQQQVPWGITRIGATMVHPSNKGTGVKVAVLDTGIDGAHPDLAVAGGVSFVADEPTWQDKNGHGTHVAGTIAALDNTIGVVGVAPEAALYAVKVLNKNGSGFWSDVVAGIEWAKNNGMQELNMSLGGGASITVEAAVKAAWDAGLVLVAAAGNSGNAAGTGNNIICPACYDTVIAVTATDITNTRASWSSTGPQAELAAPGVSISSTFKGGTYATLDGTSMASPHVAGTAALVIASGITDTNGNLRINDEVRLRLQQTATDLGIPGRDSWYGFGLVNAAAAVLPPAPPGAISGRVTDANTLAAISGATVTDGTRSATTAADGSYTIASVPPGTYAVAASKVGYVSASQTVTVDSGATATANFLLATSPLPPLSVTVTTDRASYSIGQRVRITVKVSSGVSPVAGAAVSVKVATGSGTTYNFSGTTNDKGQTNFRYTIGAADGIGTYTVAADASHPSYAPGQGQTTFTVQ